ncbi:sensor histidine kinase [Serratia microhaemolytica]|uniref:sensor histidine kinase n=1 Tax=Serratia microhaemolytica TaxID=2675110 RepID=UPI000FDE5457|nr:ATP-binding protein [Serratia microhaemolytica]
MSKLVSRFEIRQLMLCTLSPIAGILAYLLLWAFPAQSLYLKLLTLLMLCVATLYCSYHFFQQLNSRVNVICNLLEAVEQQDFSLRGSTKENGIFTRVISQVNAMVSQLSRHRQQQREMDFLLHKVLSNITISIFALNSQHRVIWCNHAAAQMLDCPAESLIGEDAGRWQLEQLLSSANSNHPVEFSHHGRPGRYKVNSDHYLVDGESHVLLFINDVDQLLRDEQKKVWQNLLRVISHEINNSLSPISSISQMLQCYYGSHPEQAPAGFAEGIALIHRRAKELIDFINSYQQLNKLAPPVKTETDIAGLIKELPLLFMQRRFELNGFDSVTARVDRGQIYQLLINIVKNADEAMSDNAEPILIDWYTECGRLVIAVKDSGVGLTNPENLFVPFYTAKPTGNGIGLILCRQIAEQHGGYLTLQNRQDSQGCQVTMSLQC